MLRKLIKQKYQRERALYALFPGRKLAICGCLIRREKPQSDGLVETFVLLEPFVRSGFTKTQYLRAQRQPSFMWIPNSAEA
jgi:hypothetical protein